MNLKVMILLQKTILHWMFAAYQIPPLTITYLLSWL